MEDMGRNQEKLPPEDWEVNGRSAKPTLEIRSDSMTVVNWVR